MTRQATPHVRLAALAAFALLGTACGQEVPPGGLPIDREVFIETFVELRLAALEAADFVVPPEERDEILARHGVDEERLVHFAEVHGPDLDFMNEVWAEVERRLQERRDTDDASA